MAGDLDFSVQLRLLNDQFNQGVDQARDKFTQYAQSVQRNVEQMNTDTERATAMLAGLNNAAPDRLTAEIRATADQLRQMGAGANISGEQVEAAMQASALQVTRLGRQLEVARQEALRLSQTSASPEDVERATANVNRLEQELNQANSASVSLANELSGAMNRASTTADGARNSIYRMANIRVPETIRGEIDQISRSLVDFQQNSGRPAAEIDRVTRQAEEQIRRLEAELRGLDDTQNRTADGANNLSGNVNKLKGAFSGLQGLLAAAGLGVGISEILETSDAFKTLEARVKLATGEGVSFVTGFEGVKRIANETFSSIESTGELFARITAAGETLGLAQGEILSVTQTINEAIKLSGGSAASADAAITQLIQGLQSGVVRGEEFNSIMEQAPRLAKAMADGLGVTRGELRAMAQDGKLTSEVVINAVQSQGDAIASEFGTLPTTVGNALQVVKNQLFDFVGEMDKTVNQSSKVAEAVSAIGNSLESLDPSTTEALNTTFELVMETVEALFVAIRDVYGAFSDVTSIMTGNEAGLITQTLQQINVAVGILADGLKGISIITDSVFGTISGIIGSVLIGIAKVNGETSTLGEELIRKQEELHARSEQNLMNFESSSAKAWDSIGKTAKDALSETAVENERVYNEMVAKGSSSAEALESQFIKVAQAKIKANDNIIADDVRLDLAQKDLQATIGDTGDIIIESSKKTQAAYLGVGESFAEVATKAQMTGVSVTESLADMVPKAQTREAVDDIISSLSAMSAQGKISNQELADGINAASNQYKEVEKQIERNIETFAAYASEVIAKNNGVLDSELEHAASLENLAIQMTETGGIIVTELDKSTVALKLSTEQVNELASAVGIGLSKEYSKAKASVGELSDGFDQLKEAGFAAGDAMIKSLTDMTTKAANSTEIEDVIAMWADLGEQGQLTGEDLAAGLELASERLDALTDGVNSVNEAYAVLGLTTRKEAGLQAEAYTQAYGIIVKDGEATAGQLKEAFEKTAKAQIAANGDVVSSQLQAQAAQKGLTIAVDETGRVTFKSMAVADEANTRVRRSVEGISNAYNGIAGSAGNAGNAMVRAANDASSAYDKLQAKIKAVKEAQAVAGGDEALKNLRIYGTEKAPSEGNQFGSRTAVEGFLKSAGLSAEQAMEEARKLYSKQGTSGGALNVGTLQGFKDGQVMTTSDLNNFKTASAYLLDIAESVRYQTTSSTARLPAAALQSFAELNKQPNYNPSNSGPTKNINVNFKLGDATASVSMPENQEGALMALLQQLQDSKAIAGY